MRTTPALARTQEIQQKTNWRWEALWLAHSQPAPQTQNLISAGARPIEKYQSRGGVLPALQIPNQPNKRAADRPAASAPAHARARPTNANYK